MNQIQEKLLKIAIEFKNICESNNLRYFIVAGSLLGAVRHNGFIPWDDDLDFCMPREDYEKFIKIAPRLLSKSYALRDFSVDKNGYAYCFAKIDDKTTTAIETSSANYGYKGGIWLDIFPLDGTFNNKFLQKIHYCIIRRLIKIRNKAYFFNKNQKLGLIHRIHLKILQFLFKGKGMHKLIHIISTLKRYDNSSYVGNLIWGYGISEIMPINFYEKHSCIIFENQAFFSPNKTAEYLKTIYGNFLELPPIEKRYSEHNFHFFDLSLSYSDYQYKH